MRCDVNCGINTREELQLRDPGIAAELSHAFGDGAWRYLDFLERAAPSRAAAWSSLAAKQLRVRAQPSYRLMVPVCECYRKLRGTLEPSIQAANGVQWRKGQPLCQRCAAVLGACGKCSE